MPSAPTKSRPAASTNSQPAEPVETATADERAAAGKAAREKTSRASHGEWEPAARRRDPVKLLEDQSKNRVQELVPIRYGRMLASPFTFFRGAAAIMAMDLAKTPRVRLCGSSSAATRTSRTSGSSPPPTAGWCWTSTTSTRRFPGPGSGT